MRLNNIKREPVKIIFFVLLTMLFTHCIVGNIVTSIAVALIGVWMCMMPRLTYEKSTYKDKLPLFLRKKDLINKIIGILVPLVLWTLLVLGNVMSSDNKILILTLLTIPVPLIIIHFLMIRNKEYPMEWLMPVLMSIATIFATEFISQNIGNFMTNLFSSSASHNIVMLWSFFIQFLIVYSTYCIVSIILPSRTLAMTTASFLFMGSAYLNQVFTYTIGMPFRPIEIFSFKNTVALISICFQKNFDKKYAIICGTVLILFFVVAHLLVKGSTQYNLLKRTKALCIGIVILAIAIAGNAMITKYIPNAETATGNNCGYIQYAVNTIDVRNKYPVGLQNKIDSKAKEMFEKEEKATTTTTAVQFGTGTTTTTAPAPAEQAQE